MRDFLWNAPVVVIALVLVGLNASSSLAQRPAVEAREPVSVTGNFGDKATPPKPKESEEDTKPGLVTRVDRPTYEAREARRIRRDPRVKVIKAERLQDRPPTTLSAEVRGGFELAQAPSDEISSFSEASGPVEVGEDDNKPGVVSPADNPQPKRYRRDPKVRVMKGNRP